MELRKIQKEIFLVFYNLIRIIKFLVIFGFQSLGNVRVKHLKFLLIIPSYTLHHPLQRHIAFTHQEAILFDGSTSVFTKCVSQTLIFTNPNQSLPPNFISVWLHLFLFFFLLNKRMAQNKYLLNK